MLLNSSKGGEIGTCFRDLKDIKDNSISDRKVVEENIPRIYSFVFENSLDHYNDLTIATQKELETTHLRVEIMILSFEILRVEIKIFKFSSSLAEIIILLLEYPSYCR